MMGKEIFKAKFEQIINEAVSESEPYINRFNSNISRVQNLINVYELIKDNESYTGDSGDVLRSAIVLLHATLEDVLRSLSRLDMKKEGGTIKNIPLFGSKNGGDKFSMNDLMVNKGKTVDSIINDSIDNYLDHSSYNNTDDIAKLLKEINVDVEKVNSKFANINNMIKRRHQIVHRADRKYIVVDREEPVDVVELSDVKEWALDVKDFIGKILSEYSLISKKATLKDILMELAKSNSA